MYCPEHGLERFNLKVIKKFNISSNRIIPTFRSRPKPGDLSGLIVGRNVEVKDVEDYIVRYFSERGLLRYVLNISLIR